MPALIEGQPIYIKGSSAKPYELKNTGGVFSCSCPAWRNQSVHIDKRTCKHLKLHCGEASELARIGAIAPNRIVTANAADAQTILDRVALQERKLRPDEKAKLNGPKLLLAHPWDGELDPTGWWMSEKLDGVRALYKDGRFVSRQGNEYGPPDWFRQGLGDRTLDGELFLGRAEFAKTISIVKSQNSGDAWKEITFRVFDAPEIGLAFEARTEFCKQTLSAAPYAKVLDQTLCEGVTHLKRELFRIEAIGGEGLMLRRPGSLYEPGRSHTLLKVKSFYDSEAEVVGHLSGKGRLKGMLGALRMRTVRDANLVVGGKSCLLRAGVEFELGTGMADSHRRLPPKVGSVVTFSFQELSKDGIPRFPVFVAVRNYE